MNPNTKLSKAELERFGGLADHNPDGIGVVGATDESVWCNEPIGLVAFEVVRYCRHCADNWLACRCDLAL